MCLNCQQIWQFPFITRNLKYLFMSSSHILTQSSALDTLSPLSENKMTAKRTRQDFLAFLDWLSEKGLMAKNTVAARKAAANKVLGILSDEEAQDVTILNLDDIMHRFSNLQGKGYTPGSMTTYLSRLRSAMDDFKQYLDNPLNFRPGVQPRARKAEIRKEPPPPAPVSNREPAPVAAPNALSIPIRPDTTIAIHGLPYDLSEAEAAKIANIIRAMATPAA
jgi:hypothetical protein